MCVVDWLHGELLCYNMFQYANPFVYMYLIIMLLSLYYFWDPTSSMLYLAQNALTTPAAARCPSKDQASP